MSERNIEIGRRIKQRREELGLTQDDLGKALWLNKSTIQRYETGKIASIKLTVLHAMAKILNVDPNWLALKTDIMGEFKPLYSEISDNIPTETDNIYFDFGVVEAVGSSPVTQTIQKCPSIRIVSGLADFWFTPVMWIFGRVLGLFCPSMGVNMGVKKYNFFHKQGLPCLFCRNIHFIQKANEQIMHLYNYTLLTYFLPKTC